MALTLLIGNKNYSSWSLRAWIAMRATGIQFDEILISLGADDFKDRVLKVSPTGRVPALIDGDQHIWESIAILEHLAEKFPRAGLWPSDAGARTHARAIAAEMHAGFIPLRSHCPMNMRRPPKKRDLPAEVQANVARIDAMWADCRARYGREGPFLFGGFARPTPCMRRWCRALRPMRSMSAPPRAPTWRRSRRCRPMPNGRRPAPQSPGCSPEDEVDWPTVLRA